MHVSTLTALWISVATTAALAQQPAMTVPTFDVVSIRRNTDVAPSISRPILRPDGGFTLFRVPVSVLIARAYPPAVPIDMVGLPAWATNERYDVSATSLLPSATLEQRAAMMRAMLADRFNLVAHVESREQDVWELVFARDDRRLGPGIKPPTVDCDAHAAEIRASPQRAAEESHRAAGGTPPPCTLVHRGDRLEGDTTVAALTLELRSAAGRYIVDKTGLTGSFHVTMTYDVLSGTRGLDAPPTDDTSLSVFAALENQLGLRLRPARASREALIIDRLEHPTEN